MATSTPELLCLESGVKRQESEVSSQNSEWTCNGAKGLGISDVTPPSC